MALGWWAEVHPVAAIPSMSASAEMFAPSFALATVLPAPEMVADAAMGDADIGLNVTVGAPTMVAAASLRAPTVTAGIAANAPAMDATATLNTPALSASSSLSVPAMEASASMRVAQPIVGNGFPYTFPFAFGEAPISSGTVEASVAAASGEMFAPILSASAALTAPPLTAEAEMLIGGISASADLTVPAMTSSAATTTPTIQVIPGIEVEFDAASTVNFSTGDFSFTHSATAGAAVIVMVVTTNDASTMNGVTYGGAAMTLWGSVPLNNVASNGTLWFYRLDGVAGGSQTVAVDKNGFQWVRAQATSYKNVASFGTLQTAYGSGTSLSHAATSVTNGMVIQAFGLRENSVITPSGGTNRANASNTGGSMCVSDSVSSVTFTATLASTSTWASAYGVLNPG